MNYYLVMKIAHNNYQPFDYNLLNKYDNEDLTTLEGIDTFTSKFNDLNELKERLYLANFIDDEDFSKEFKIIFYQNNAIRELKYGLCFKETADKISAQFILNFIQDNLDNPLILNKIYNEFNKMSDKTISLITLLDIIKNIRKAKNIEDIYCIFECSYKEKRQLALFIYKTFYDKISLEKNAQRVRSNV